jgi:hypothetical protein
MTTPDYDTDFYAWTQAQAAAIRAKEVVALDIGHLAPDPTRLSRRAPGDGLSARPRGCRRRDQLAPGDVPGGLPVANRAGAG